MKRSDPRRLTRIALSLLIMAGLILGATAIGLLFRGIGFEEANIVIVYLMSVVLTARFTNGYGYGVLSSVMATLTFNFMFTQPYYTLTVYDPAYFVTFAVMMITAIITGALTSAAKLSARQALQREAETAALFRLTNRLTEAGNLDKIVSIAADAMGDVLRCPVYVHQIDDDTQKGRESSAPLDGKTLVWSRKPPLGADNNHLSAHTGSWFLEWPILGREGALGVVCIPGERTLTESEDRILRSMTESIALAMDRLCSAAARVRLAEETERERYRGNLLRAISHDLRTPLSGIMGTAEMLRDMTPPDDPRHALTQDVFREANWLHGMVENILNLTRLRDGALPLSRQMEPVEEVVGGAVNRVMRQSGRAIEVEAPAEVLFAPMDVRLIEQVLVNLLDNAVRHTLPGDEIRVTVRHDVETAQAVICVADRGSGIQEVDLPHIFQMFYTTPAKQPDASRGAGLGLSICEAIVRAHGGMITARNRIDGPGAIFEFTLPLEVSDHAESK